MAIINFHNNLSIENLPILKSIPIFSKSIIDIVIIGADVYRINYILTKAQVFAIFMKDLEFPIEKDVRLETDPKNAI